MALNQPNARTNKHFLWNEWMKGKKSAGVKSNHQQMPHSQTAHISFSFGNIWCLCMWIYIFCTIRCCRHHQKSELFDVEYKMIKALQKETSLCANAEYEHTNVNEAYTLNWIPLLLKWKTWALPPQEIIIYCKHTANTCYPRSHAKHTHLWHVYEDVCVRAWALLFVYYSMVEFIR